MNLLAEVKHEDYYVKMGVAWALSIFYIKQQKLTLQLLQQNNLDDFTHNKAIQKIRESFRVSGEEMLNGLKRGTAHLKNENKISASCATCILYT